MSRVSSILSGLAAAGKWTVAHPKSVSAGMAGTAAGSMLLRNKYGDVGEKAGGGFGEGVMKSLFPWDEVQGENRREYDRTVTELSEAKAARRNTQDPQTRNELDARIGDLKARADKLAAASRKEGAVVRHEGGLSKLTTLAPRAAADALTGVIDPLADWINTNKATAAALTGATLLPLGVLSYMSWRDKRRRRRELEAGSGLEKAAGIPWGSIGKGLKWTAGTTAGVVPPYMYFAPPSWPMSKAKVLGGLYDRTVGQPVERAAVAAMKDKSKILDELLPEAGRKVGEAVGDLIASPGKLAVGAAAPVALYLLWRMTAGREDESKILAAKALRKAREELDERGARMSKTAGWASEAGKYVFKNLPAIATIGGTAAISGSALMGGAGRRVAEGSGEIGKRLGRTVDTLVREFDTAPVAKGSRAATEAMLSEIDKSKWPLLLSLAGGSAALAAAKYFAERREREAEASMESDAERILNKKRKGR